MSKPQLVTVTYHQETDTYRANAPVYNALVFAEGPTREVALENLLFRLQSLADERGVYIEELKARLSPEALREMDPTPPGLRELVALRKRAQPMDYTPVTGHVKRVEDAEAQPASEPT